MTKKLLQLLLAVLSVLMCLVWGWVLFLDSGPAGAQVEAPVVLVGAAEPGDRLSLFLQVDGEIRDLEIAVWDNHFTISPSCNVVLFTGFDDSNGAFNGLLDLRTNVLRSHLDGLNVDAESFMFPAMYNDEVYAVVVALPDQRAIFVSGGDWNQTMLLVRSNTYYLDGLKWADQDTLLVRIRSGYGTGPGGYISADLPTGIEQEISEAEYNAVPGEQLISPTGDVTEDMRTTKMIRCTPSEPVQSDPAQ